MSKKLLLVFPKSFAMSYGDMRFVSHLIGKAGLLNVSLPTVAALTPPEFDVTIVDENYDNIPYHPGWDLVGITGFHIQLDQARKVAERFRDLEVPVVCGGPSVSVSPERWRKFADVLLIGEAERTWPQFCADFSTGQYDDSYRDDDRFGLDVCPLPDYSGLAAETVDRYFGGIVQTSRGCPFDCEFCDVIAYVGRKMRYKTVDLVMREIRQLAAMGLRFIVLADDNFTAGREKSKEILTAIKRFTWGRGPRVNFATQLSIDAAGDEELLRLATQAGLNRVLIGIESPDKDSLAEANKNQNVRSDLVADVVKFHQMGIMVMGTSIVGFDHDDLSIFQRQFDYFMEAGILSPQPFPLQAPDATPLKERMIKEGRYLEWQSDLPPDRLNNFNTFTMKPKQFTVEQMEQGLHWLIRELYRPINVLARFKSWVNQFEQSPYRRDLKIPGNPLDRQSLGILGRLGKYLLLRGSKDERWLLRQMVKTARSSSHPQRFGLAVTVFLQALNTRYMLERLNPQIERVRYPG